MILTKRKRIRKTKKHFYSTSMRIWSAVLLATFLSWMFAPYTSLIPRRELAAQPITIPSLNNQGFQSQDLDPYFNQAANSQEQAVWETAIAAGVGAIYAVWEAAVDAEINSHVVTINQAGNFSSVTEAQDYLRQMLLLQKQQQQSDWTIAAEASINLQRTAFLTKLANEQKTTVEINTKQDLKTATNRTNSNTNRINPDISPEQRVDQQLQSIEQGLENGRRAWEQDFQDQLNNGLYQFQAAQNVLASDYQNLVQTIDAKDLEFQTTLTQLETQEQQARAQVQAAITGLQGFLNGFGMFHDAGNNLTTEGQQLQTLITSLNTGLANGDPLTGLMTQVRDFMDAQRVSALAQKTHWDGLTNYTNQNYSRTFAQDNGNVDWATIPYPIDVHMMNGHADADGAFAYVYSLYQNTYVHNNGLDGDTTKLINFIRNTTGLEATNIHSIDIRALATGPRIIPGPLTWLQETAGSLYNEFMVPGDTNGALAYAHCSILGCVSLLEPEVEVLFTYDAYDPAAQANANLFDGYASALATELANWNDNILPGLQNWESAVAAYKADYQTWKTDADAKKAQALTTYNTGIQQLGSQRGQWLVDMQEQYRQGKRKWDAQQKTFRDTKADFKEQILQKINSGEKTDEVLRNESDRIVSNLISNLPQSVPGLPNVGASLNGIRAQLPELQKEFLEKSRKNRPDSRQLASALDAFAKSTRAVMNTSMANAMNRQAQEVREQAVGQMRNVARAYGYTNVQVDDQGNVRASREVHSGGVRVKPGADPTNPDAYEPEMVQQQLNFAAPVSLTLAGNADVFGSADSNAVLRQFSDNLQDYNKDLNNRFESIQNNLTAAEELAMARRSRYDSEVNRRVQEATLLKDLAETLLKGGSLGGWVQSQVQSRAAVAIGEATGIPTGIISALLGGSNIQDAVQGYAEGLIVQEIETATGIPGLGAHLLSQYKAKQARKNSPTGKMANMMAGVVSVAAFGVGAGLAGGGGINALLGGSATGGFVGKNQEKLADFFYENPMAMKATAVALGGGAGGVVFDTADAYHRGGGLGVVASVANNALKVTNLVGADISVSYDRENGWGGSVGVGFDAGIGKVGVSATFQEGEGMVGASVGLRNKNLGLAAGLNWSKDGGYSAFAGVTSPNGRASFGLGYSESEGASAYVGVGKGKLTYSERDGAGASMRAGGVTVNYTERQGISGSISADLGQITGESRLTGTSASLTFDRQNGFGVGVNSSQHTPFGTTVSGGFSVTQNGGFNTNSNINANNNIPIIASLGDLQSEIDTLSEVRRKAAMRGKRVGLVSDLNLQALDGVDISKLSDVQLSAILRNPAKFENALNNAVGGDIADFTPGYETSETSRGTGFLDQFVGNITDDLSGLTGNISDDQGYVDADGVYHQRVCFTAGTLVRTKSGYKSIENIKPGEMVLSWNEKTGKVEYNRVLQTFTRTAKAIYKIKYADGTVIETTWNHPFYIEGRGWVKAKDLRVGFDSHTSGSVRVGEISSYKSSSLFDSAIRISSTEVEYQTSKVFNFNVSNAKSYFVSKHEILVHNSGYGSGIGQVLADQLRLRNCKTDACIKKVREDGLNHRVGLATGTAAGLGILSCWAFCGPASIGVSTTIQSYVPFLAKIGIGSSAAAITRFRRGSETVQKTARGLNKLEDKAKIGANYARSPELRNAIEKGKWKVKQSAGIFPKFRNRGNKLQPYDKFKGKGKALPYNASSEQRSRKAREAYDNSLQIGVGFSVGFTHGYENTGATSDIRIPKGRGRVENVAIRVGYFSGMAVQHGKSLWKLIGN